MLGRGAGRAESAIKTACSSCSHCLPRTLPTHARHHRSADSLGASKRQRQRTRERGKSEKEAGDFATSITPSLSSHAPPLPTRHTAKTDALRPTVTAHVLLSASLYQHSKESAAASCCRDEELLNRTRPRLASCAVPPLTYAPKHDLRVPRESCGSRLAASAKELMLGVYLRMEQMHMERSS